MRRLAISISLFMSSLPAAAIAEDLPSFTLEFSAWNATDVVVVNESGVVREVWKGSLKPNAVLPVGQWKITAAADVSYDRLGLDRSKLPADRIKRVTGKRRVIFLRREAEGGEWKAASIFEDWDAATIWVEGDEGFAKQQWMNPGPSLIRPYSSEKKVRDSVLRIAKTQSSIETAAQLKDPAARAQALVKFLDGKNYLALDETLEGLKTCGKDVWSVIRPLLEDESKLPIHSRLIHVAGTASLEQAKPLIERVIAEEMEYWNSLTEEQQKGGSYNEPMHFHYSKLSACLNVLKRSGYVDEKGLVAKLRKKWDKSPNLKHLGTSSGGRSPILQYADEILKKQ